MMNVADAPSPLVIEVPAVSTSVTEARRSVAGYAARVGVDPQDVELAVAEAVGNAVTHAYPEGSIGTVTVRAEAAPEGLTVTVGDDGVGMRPNLSSPGLGLGLALIARLARECRVTTNRLGGTTVEMVFARVA
jgi:anti-sigma regulatory factor (Ser/Thr protein kinase)